MSYMTSATGPSAPPGWYHDQMGLLRWWDGVNWGPTLPTHAPTESGDARTWALLSHLGMFMLWFVGPLVIRQTIGRRDDYVRRHATEALNANLTLAGYWNIGPVLGIILSDATGNTAWNALWAGMAFAFIWIAVSSALGARAAYQGRPYKYRAIVRFVPGGWPKQLTAEAS